MGSYMERIIFSSFRQCDHSNKFLDFGTNADLDESNTNLIENWSKSIIDELSGYSNKSVWYSKSI